MGCQQPHCWKKRCKVCASTWCKHSLVCRILYPVSSGSVLFSRVLLYRFQSQFLLSNSFISHHITCLKFVVIFSLISVQSFISYTVTSFVFIAKKSADSVFPILLVIMVCSRHNCALWQNYYAYRWRLPNLRVYFLLLGTTVPSSVQQIRGRHPPVRQARLDEYILIAPRLRFDLARKLNSHLRLTVSFQMRLTAKASKTLKG